jgi:hypothetical protein
VSAMTVKVVTCALNTLVGTKIIRNESFDNSSIMILVLPNPGFW